MSESKSTKAAPMLVLPSFSKGTDNRPADTTYLARDYRKDIPRATITDLDSAISDPDFGMVSILADIRHAWDHKRFDVAASLCVTLGNLVRKLGNLAEEAGTLGGLAIGNVCYTSPKGSTVVFIQTGKGLRCYSAEIFGELAIAGRGVETTPDEVKTWTATKVKRVVEERKDRGK